MCGVRRLVRCAQVNHPYLFHYDFSCLESAYTTGVAGILIPRTQNVPFGWHERSCVLLRKSENIKPFLFHCCGFLTLLFPPPGGWGGAPIIRFLKFSIKREAQSFVPSYPSSLSRSNHLYGLHLDKFLVSKPLM